jgi:3D (Asp-Asp-Asp) domain-containing protein
MKTKKKTRKTVKRLSIPVSILIVMFFVTLSTFSLAQQINTPRYRLTIEDTQKQKGWLGTISDIFQNLKLSSFGSIKPEVGQKLAVTAVAYSPTVDQNDSSPCITASGTVVRRGVVATNFLPIGTRLKIGEDIYIVEDRMNAKYNGKKIIDIWHPTTKEAIAFGAKRLEIEILPKEDIPSPTPIPSQTSETIAEKPKNLWEFTKLGFKNMGELFAKNVQTRTYAPEADCSKVVGKTLK